MKKLIFALLLLNLACVFSQTKKNANKDNIENGDANGITGFCGIKFGTDKRTVEKMMLEKGWKKTSETDDKIEFTNGVYEGKKIGFDKSSDYSGIVALHFDIEKRFYRANVGVYAPLTDSSRNWFSEIWADAFGKYKLRFRMRNSEDEHLYIVMKGKNGNILLLITNDHEKYIFMNFDYIAQDLFIKENSLIMEIFADINFINQEIE